MTTLLKEHPTTAHTFPEYKTEHSDKDAPKNLHLEIEVGIEKALIHCRFVEHLGHHTNRAVTFRADGACKLKFDDGTVFGTTEQKLEAGKATTLFIDDKVGRTVEVGTYCEVEKIDGSGKPPTKHRSPPRIVVP